MQGLRAEAERSLQRPVRTCLRQAGRRRSRRARSRPWTMRRGMMGFVLLHQQILKARDLGWIHLCPLLGWGAATTR